MFRKNELTQIDMEYFQVLQTNGYHIVLKSRNTHHLWDIYCRDASNGYRSLVISHKHDERYSFHRQAMMHPKTILEAQNLIKAHDTYYLDKREMLTERHKAKYADHIYLCEDK